ncbi:Stealth CR1 domain-containing protein [Aliivibrio sifiae]|uniref:Stealth protein CR2 conserved region 2 domain-containing protein n=1 Tax=Aliivibrio sifiae TaxID=566293 RepID=A0A2S7X0Y6_9GAMM|nr:Stealth CR1 domain-containing protein [Aliivibrio sifiae]PQJ83311.1 hypothetical protein BTO22_18140 [Aliivibrio sifiae]
MKIDLVYCWVNNNDASWNKKKEHYYNLHNPCCKNNESIRYADNNELKISLRSVARNAPWINHIYIITDEQIPSWLRSNDFITIIDHKNIIPNEYLPTFNSSVIEAHIHNIDSLSEHYLYLNDDVLIGKECSSSLFFKQSEPVIFTSTLFPKKIKLKNNFTYNQQSIFNARVLVEQETGVLVRYNIKHGIRCCVKSRYKKIYNLYFNKLEKSFHEKFRQTPVSIHALYAFHEIAVKKAKPIYQKNIKSRSIINSIFKNTFLNITNGNLNELLIIEKTKPLIICINDISNEAELLYSIKNTYLNLKSSYEK